MNRHLTQMEILAVVTYPSDPEKSHLHEHLENCPHCHDEVEKLREAILKDEEFTSDELVFLDCWLNRKC